MHGGGSSRCYFHPKEEVVGVCALCLNERLLILAAKQASSSSSSSSCRSSKLFSSSLNATTNTIISSRSRNGRDNNNNNTHRLSKTKTSLFGLGTLFCSRDTASRPCRSCKAEEEKEDGFLDAAADDDHDSTSTSREDESFISIKFGDNGLASWDKGSNTVSKVSLQHCSMSYDSHNSVKNATTNKVIGSNNSSRKSVVEHAKPRSVSTLRWGKRIAQLLEVMRWKKCSKMAENGGVGRMKVETVKMRNDRGWVRTLRLNSKK